jgi:hypothetical protein
MVTATMRPADFKDLGTVWTGWGGIWGGDLDDPIHFEYPGFSQPRRAPGQRKPSETFLHRVGRVGLDFATALPFGVPESIALALLGIPTSAQKTLSTSEKQAILATYSSNP